jgi:hypothetical protein
MQLQIECNPIPFQQQSCVVCGQLFKTTEAKVIICSNQGKKHGEVCPTCLGKGFNWLNQRFEQLNKPQREEFVQHSQPLTRPLVQPLAISVDA